LAELTPDDDLILVVMEGEKVRALAPMIERYI
jgi:hypothetical protein